MKTNFAMVPKLFRADPSIAIKFARSFAAQKKAMQVDHRTGVIVWCVTGPLRPRLEGFKDLGYYIAEGYEGLVHKKRCDLKIGMRYFFQPTMCMLQWRHSGLINYLNRTADALQIRIEGLWIG